MISRRLQLSINNTRHHQFCSSSSTPSIALIMMISSTRTAYSPKSNTSKSNRNLMPKNYFVGGKSPVSVPKTTSSAIVNSPPSFANAGLITKWRDSVQKEFVEMVKQNEVKTRVSFASAAASKEVKNSSSSSVESSSSSSGKPHPGSIGEAKFKCSSCSGIWFAKVRERNDPQQDTGCPHCLRKNKEQLVLEYAAPQIASEWDLARNKMLSSLTPSNTSVNSEATLWWSCELCSGSFVASVKDRVSGDVHCPTCVEAKLDPTLNNRSTSLRHAMLKKETQKKQNNDQNENTPIKNPLNKLDSVRSETLAPWKCSKCGCSWKGSSFTQRLQQHSLCPSCSGEVPTSANLLRRNRPDVFRAIAHHQTIYTENLADKLTIYSNEVVWFRCFSCKKEYKMSIRQRCQYGSRMNDGTTFGVADVEKQTTMNPCPHCQRARRVIALENDARGNVDGYISAKNANLHLKGGGRVAPESKQHIVTRNLAGPN